MISQYRKYYISDCKYEYTFQGEEAEIRRVEIDVITHDGWGEE